MPKPTTLVVAGAPSNTATVYVNTGPSHNNGYPVSTEDSATLLRSEGIATTLSDDSVLGIAVDTAGTYTVRLGNGSDTTAVTFATAGTPASLSLTPATQTVLVGATATLTLELKDASGNLTQAALGDTITLAASADDTPSTPTVTAAAIYAGTFDDTLTAQAGTQTITATPFGTLPPAVTAATATVTGSGTVSSTAVTNVVVTSPAAAINIPAVTTAQNTRTVQVPAGSASIGVKIDDTTGNPAGSSLRVGFTLNQPAINAGATINGTAVTATDDTVFVNLTTDASKSATTTVILGGGGTNAGAVLSMRQYDVVDAVVSGPSLTVNQLAPAVYGDDITFDPAGPLVGTIGTSIPVAVTVDDSFGAPQAGWTVQAWRNPATGADVLLSSGTTNASGVANVTVVNAAGITSGSSEPYYFTAIPPVGSSVNSSAELTVSWTTTGAITSLSVATAPGSSPISDPAGTAATTGALLTVPYDGYANTVSTATYNLSTKVAGGTANLGEVARIVPTAVPATAVTVSVPVGSTGIFVSEDDSTVWNGGSTSVTVASDDTVYVFGTAVGETSVVVTAGGKSVTVPVKIQTSSNAAYNMALSPEEQSVGAGSINTVTLTVTDVFGNPVQTVDDTGKVRITASGEVLLAGYATTNTFNTDANGEVDITIIAGNSAGVGTLAATPASTNTAAAWTTGYSPPPGAPAPTTSAAADVLVGSEPVEPALFIVAYRSGGNVIVDGDSEGFERRDVVTLQTRTYNNKEGKWRPWRDRAEAFIKSDGSFSGVISTTAKVRVRAVSGDVKSNNLVVQK